MITSTTSGSGDGGLVAIRAPNASVILDGANVDAHSVAFSIGSDLVGAPGAIEIDAAALSIKNKGRVTSDNEGAGNGGNIAITAGSVDIDDSTVTASTFYKANAGTISIAASGAYRASNSASVSTSSSHEGDAGSISIAAGSVDLSSGALINAQAGGLGDAGQVSLRSTAGSINIANSNIVTVASGGPATPDNVAYGAAGSISLRSADDINIASASLTSQAFNQAKRAGGISMIAVDQINLGVASGSTTGTSISIKSDLTGTYVPPPAGQAGPEIAITGKSVSMKGVGEREFNQGRVDITSQTSEAHPAGNVRIASTGGLLDIERSSISSSTTGSGPAGGITFSSSASLNLVDSQVESTTSSTGTGEPFPLPPTRSPPDAEL